MYYYAVVDVNYIVTDVHQLEEEVNDPAWIPIDSYNMDLVGLWYNVEDQTYSHIGNKYLIPLKIVDGAGSGLDADLLDGKQASEFALANHTHEGGSVGEHNHDDEYAAIDHTHNEYAEALHLHSGYAAVSHDHDTVYAPINHTHEAGNYLPLTGGAVVGDVDLTGELDIDGVLRMGGQQALYNSGTNLIVGTNNLPVIIGCPADKDVTINGMNLGCGNIHPRGHASHGIGISSKRWKDVFLVNSPNVSSDRRLKDKIESVDADKMLEFVDKLNVVDYVFKDNPEVERIGLIAQEVEEAGGDKFIEIGDDGMYGLHGADLVYPLIAAVQALYSRVLELEAKLE